jgi:uncharacterized protein YqhQ
MNGGKLRGLVVFVLLTVCTANLLFPNAQLFLNWFGALFAVGVLLHVTWQVAKGFQEKTKTGTPIFSFRLTFDKPKDP